jgi:hypothetical protein
MTSLAVWLAAACRLYIAVVLAAALLGKAASPSTFRETIAGLPLLPERAAGVAAFAVIGAEAAILVAVAVAPRAGIAAAIAMFALFWLVILAALAGRRPMVCNCFGGAGRPVSWLDLVRNGMLIGASTLYLLAPPAVGLAPAAWLLLLGIALIAFLISTNLDEIAAAAR